MKAFSSFVLLCLIPLSVHAFDLSGTVFEKAGNKHGVDPVLLYSVALAESASGRGQGLISPWPWALRTQNVPFYAKTAAQAKAKLRELQEQHGKLIDVGIMQVNIKWHGHRVASPYDLLDAETNVMVGAAVLAEAIRSVPNDLELGIGRYHVWQDEYRARNYGSRVLAIYQNLLSLGR